MATRLKGLVVAVAAGLGGLLALGCVLAALFEVQGFGRPRDVDPRIGYLFLLALGLAACIVVPVALWRALLPASAPAWPLALALDVAGWLLILGISLL
ncbi:MAG TPA: hypothetical protein VNI55_06080 [Gaiellaceae bacterium]|nr:hypothetical protein [Gaiellaceae bacterium]